MSAAHAAVLLLALSGLSGFAHGQSQTGPRPRPPAGSTAPSITESWFYVGGRVLYADRLRPAVRIQVNLLRNAGALAGTAFTNPQGEFEFVGLARAMYIVEVAVEGYQPVRERVDLYLGSRRDITILLEPKTGVTSNSSGTALSLRELKIPDKARKSFEEGIRELHENHRPDRSLDYFRKAIAIYPDYDEAYVQLGLAYLSQGQSADAQAIIEKAMEVNPSNARAYTVLGTFQNQQGRAQEALQSLQRALKLDPHAWQVHYELGRSLLQLGKIEEAYGHAREALKRNGQGPGLHLLVYNLCIRRGDYQAALVEIDEFVKLFPTHPAAPKLLEKKDGLRQAVAVTAN